MDERVCYLYACPKYPKCKRARGKGCCIECEEEPQDMIQEGECTRENGFPFFIED